MSKLIGISCDGLFGGNKAARAASSSEVDNVIAAKG